MQIIFDDITVAKKEKGEKKKERKKESHFFVMVIFQMLLLGNNPLCNEDRLERMKGALSFFVSGNGGKAGLFEQASCSIKITC